MRLAAWVLAGTLGMAVAAGAQQAGPSLVTGGVMAGMLVERVAPVYPEMAKAAGIEGVVVMHAVIGKDGRVENLHVLSGPEMLRMAALDAVRQWRYKPFLLNGGPVEVDTTVTVNFQMGEVRRDGDAGGEAASGPPPASARDGAVRVSGGVMAGLLISKQNPAYPDEAAHNHVAGTVVLAVTVGRDGSVESAEPISGPEVFRRPAVDAVLTWRYRPYLLNGEPVRVLTTVTTNFSLAD